MIDLDSDEDQNVVKPDERQKKFKVEFKAVNPRNHLFEEYERKIDSNLEAKVMFKKKDDPLEMEQDFYKYHVN